MPTSPAICRFGDFTFDPASGELEGTGGITRLQPQVAAVLDLLIAGAGKVVTRAELQARLWPDTTVEFDDGLNFCIRQLRVALHDDANAPVYIETLPRRGYRFLPAVTFDSQAVAPAAGAVPGEVPIVVDDPVSHRRRRSVSAGVVVLVMAAAAFLLWHEHRERGPRVVLGILPFAADTTDPTASAYQQRLFDQLIADARAEPSWQVAIPPATGATHVLAGSLTRDGNAVKIFVQLTAAGDPRKLWADDVVDSYGFAGNAKMTADRIEKNIARILIDSIPRNVPAPP